MTRQAISMTALGLLAVCLAAPALAEDWPTYLHDGRRSSASGEKLALPLSEEWVFTPAQPPSHAWGDPQPKPVEKLLELPRLRFDDAFHVAAVGDRVYFGSSSENKVWALDAATGRTLWQFYAEGPVRMAPTVWKGKVYVGSDDGRVYCLDAGDGHVVWTFSAAPSPERILGNGRLISVWPVRTGVAVEGGVAYFGAGVFPAEGLYLYAVRAEDGTPVWKNDTYGQGGLGTVSPQGYLVASDEKLFVPSGRAMPAAFGRKDGKFLFHRNVGWRDIGLSGGTYNVLLGDILFNATEQVIGIRETDGQLLLAEGLPAETPTQGARRITGDSAALYRTTGKELVAVARDAWVTANRQVTDALRKVKSLAKQRNDLAILARSDKQLESQVAAVQKSLDEAVAALKAIEGRRDEGTKWRTPCTGTDSLVLAGGTLFAGGADTVMAFEAATGKDLWSARVTGKARGLAVANGRLFVSTDKGSIHCFVPGAGGKGRQAAPAVRADPFPKDDRTGFHAKTAEAIVKESGVTRGYALILGGGTGRLALELARRTDLAIYIVDPDPKNVAAAREALSAAGVYGARVTVTQAALDTLPYADYFANLVVCEGGVSSGATPTPPAEVLRMLKPCGGVAYVGRTPGAAAGGPAPAALKDWLAEFQKALDALGDTGTKVATTGEGSRITRGPLPGAGSWTHEYGEPGNTACGDDQLVRGPIGILWYGEPGPEQMPSRHADNSSPLAFGGRMFVEGENVVMAYDAYNGLLLWQQKIPGALRLHLKSTCSNLAGAGDSLFVVVGDKCHRLDVATGKTLRTYPAPPGAEDTRRNWTYVATAGGLLFGSAGPDCLFAVEIESGKLRWKHQGSTILPTTVCIGDGRVLFVDRTVTPQQEEEALAGIPPEMRVDARRAPIAPDVRLVVALDAESGKTLWERPQYVSDCVKVGASGGELTAMYAHNVLLLCGQPWNGHFWKEFLAGAFSRRSLIALAASDGRPLWSGRKGYRSRPLVIGDQIIAEPWAYDLYTGAEKMRPNPVTGADERWQMSRPGHHCGNIAAAPGALFFRSGSTAYYDLGGDYGTAHFGAQRPGCWINCIPANGLVMMPEAASGCLCPFAVQTTIVFEPRRTSRVWGMFSAPGPVLPVKHLAINFGAPGDRKDSAGTLWIAYPRPYAGRLVLDVKLQAQVLAAGGYFAGNADFLKMDGTADPWIFASGCRGLARCTVPLAQAGTSGRYTVRLCFAEPDGARAGQRVFDVKLQGRTVLKNLDVSKETGGRPKALVKEVKGIEAAEALTLELEPKGKGAAPAAMPVISGIEIVREEPGGP